MRSFVIAIAIATCLIAGIASQGFADVKDIPSEVSAAGGIAEGVAQDVTNTVRSLVGGGSGNAGAGAGSNAGFGTSVNAGAGPGRKRSIYKRGSARTMLLHQATLLLVPREVVALTQWRLRTRLLMQWNQWLLLLATCSGALAYNTRTQKTCCFY